MLSQPTIMTMKRTAFLMAAIVWAAGCQAMQEKVAEAPRAAQAVTEFDASRYEDIPAEKGRVYWIGREAQNTNSFFSAYSKGEGGHPPAGIGDGYYIIHSAVSGVYT